MKLVTVRLRVLTKQIRDFSTFNVSNVSRLCPSTRCVTAANLRTFSIKTTFPFRMYFSSHNPTELHHYFVTCIILLPSITF
jgi:hypothetical protein